MNNRFSGASAHLIHSRNPLPLSSRAKRARNKAGLRQTERIRAALEAKVAREISRKVQSLAANPIFSSLVAEFLATGTAVSLPTVAPLARSGHDDLDTIGAAVADDAFAPNARAKAVLRGKEIAAQDLIESGGSYSLEDVRKLLNGVSRQSIEKRVREGKLLAIPGPNNKRFYPVAQFTDSGDVVDSLPAVMRALPTNNGFAILNFLVNPNSQLDNAKPIDLLKGGAVERVVEAAQGYGEPGA